VSTLYQKQAIESYILGKDGNRPHLLDAAFSPDATLRMVVETQAISFPPLLTGRAAIAQTLVQQFNQTYENVYTFCVGVPPQSNELIFSCPWWVVMSSKQDGTVRMGCGRYDWTFAQSGGVTLVVDLKITIATMEVLPPDALLPLMTWTGGLPYPWCPPSVALLSAPDVPGVQQFLQAISRLD
jgi:hypothetical protein